VHLEWRTDRIVTEGYLDHRDQRRSQASAPRG
jgi:hypothetical protein